MVKLFCAIVGAAGSVFEVDIDENASVSALKKAIKHENTATITCDAKDLQLFLAKTTAGAWLTEADVKEGVSDTDGFMLLDGAGAPLKFVGLSGEDVAFEVTRELVKDKKTPVHVLVKVRPPDVGSKRLAEEDLVAVLKKLKPVSEDFFPKTLTEFKPFPVNEDEFQLDRLAVTQASAQPIVLTPDLHEFWKGFGEFPQHYFVRMEEVVFWEVIKKLLFKKGRVAIIGSPGVGKSCFLMLVGLYLAYIVKKKVLIIRRVKEEDEENAVVFFDGKGNYARLTNLRPMDLFAIRVQAEVEGAVVLVDGFPPSATDSSTTGLGRFKLLATSCQFDPKNDDSSSVVVLPAWREDDLLCYATLTEWVIETGLRKIKRQDTPWQKLVNEQYFYSGGSLREFCRTRDALEIRVAKSCGSVTNSQAFDLVYNYGGGGSKDQVDRLRRHYVADYSQERHYYDSRRWKLVVDSGYVLSNLGQHVDTAKQLNVYKYAKSVGAGFHGVAYELLLHNAVRGAFTKQQPIVLKMRKESTYEKIEIMVPNVDCSGDDEASCYLGLPTLRENTYWYPNYPFFPFIDVVTTCKAFPRDRESDYVETIVAYIQVTISSEKTFKPDRLMKLNEEMDKNQLLKEMKRALVVVGPDSGLCERFKLHDAPETFLTMVSCFNPEELELKFKSLFSMMPRYILQTIAK